jgi:hypothetical protein
MIQATTRATPDPLGFTADALSLRGALIEWAGEPAATDGRGEPRARALALLPAPLAVELELPEECHLSALGADGAIACGFGSPLLGRLLADARSDVPLAWASLDVEPPRAGQARALAERFVLRNGLARVEEVLSGTRAYLAAFVGWVADCDDRQEGAVSFAFAAADGAEADGCIAQLFDPRAGAAEAGAPGLDALASAAPLIAARAERGVREALGPALARAARRHAREHQRVATYFAALLAEARAPRRRLDRATIAAKIERLIAERDAKLAATAERFRLRVTMRPVAIVCAELPVARVRVSLRRRKASRDLWLCLPSRAHALDRPSCDGCLGATAAPAACDDALHLLCDSCAPAAEGRLSCPACAALRSHARPRTSRS